MDKEKLNEAAWDYHNTNRYEDNPYRADIMDAFCYGADWLMKQPLADRLTDEEKEKIIKRYNDELDMAQHFHKKMKMSTDPSSTQHFAKLREGYVSRLKMLEQIFGKDLFNEK
ncbi:MAG: hypothetical protein K2H46_03865 [Muribaculaceae bacterium]|nr:hypothetical protein [Muribaculaceae bacterium]